MRAIVRKESRAGKAKVRISAHIPVKYKQLIQNRLEVLDWSESDFVSRAIDAYFPTLDDLAKRRKEEKA